MRVVIQRVSSAHVTSIENGNILETGRIDHGFLILLGVRADDTEQDAQWLADKIATLRVFADKAGKLNLSLHEVDGSALLISNFTLYGDCRKGRRPSFSTAASGAVARGLYECFGRMLAELSIPVQYGVFGAEMQITLVNDGPVTLVIDSPLDTMAEI
jgi:D-tyrosyl-tRNA(Tyr) deacylase